MNTGTSAAKEAGNMSIWTLTRPADRDCRDRKQLLITRGALDDVSIANDVAKYFAIIPAMFAACIRTDKLKHMRLHFAQSAILAAVIFNALIIVALIPLALRGVRYKRPVPVRCCVAPRISTDWAESSCPSSVSKPSTSSSSSFPGSADLTWRVIVTACGNTSPRCEYAIFPVIFGVAYPLLITGMPNTRVEEPGRRLRRSASPATWSGPS